MSVLDAWLQALVMVPGVALGGYAGVWAAKRCRRRPCASSWSQSDLSWQSTISCA